MSGYKKIAEGLKAMAEGFEALANEDAQAPTAETASTEAKEEVAPKTEKKPAKKAKAEPKELEQKEADTEEDADAAERRKVFAVKDSYTEEDIRAAVHFVNSRGHLDEVKKLFKTFGAKNISSLPAEHYTEAMEKVREIDAGHTQ